MTNTFLVALNDGIKFKTTDIDLKVIRVILEARNTVAVRLNRKGIQKHLIGFIADEESTNPDGKNLSVTVANEVFYFSVDDIDVTIESVISDINNKQWIEVAGGLVFNRNAFQYLEEHIKQA